MQETQIQEKSQTISSNNSNSLSVLTIIFIAVIISSSISIAVSWWILKKNNQEVFVADITKIVENKKKSLIDSYKADSSQENMAKIDRDLLTFLNNLDSILSEYSEGNRIIFKREAVIDGKYEDITEQLEEELKNAEYREKK